MRLRERLRTSRIFNERVKNRRMQTVSFDGFFMIAYNNMLQNYNFYMDLAKPLNAINGKFVNAENL